MERRFAAGFRLGSAHFAMVSVVRASPSRRAPLLGCGMLNSPNRSVAICPTKLPPGTCFSPKLPIQNATRWEGELEFKESHKRLSCTVLPVPGSVRGTRWGAAAPRGHWDAASPRAGSKGSAQALPLHPASQPGAPVLETPPQDARLDHDSSSLSSDTCFSPAA